MYMINSSRSKIIQTWTCSRGLGKSQLIAQDLENLQH